MKIVFELTEHWRVLRQKVKKKKIIKNGASQDS